MRIKNLTFVLCFALLAPLKAAETDDEQAQRILERGLGQPTVSYEGVMTVTHWYGPHTKSQEVHVRFEPPNSYRREFLRPDGSLRRVVVSDGTNEEVELVQQNKSLVGQAAKHVHKQMSSDAEWGLLKKNYELRLVGSEKVAGRPVWVITLTPLVKGKLSQKLKIDKDTGIVLENKRSRLSGNYVVQSRYSQFQTVPSFDQQLFVIDMKTAEDHEFAPDFLSRDDLNKSSGRATMLPASLPFGFEFESADVFTVDAKEVSHLRYTDGLSVLSVFETATPVHLNSNKTEMCENGSIWHTKSHGRNYTVMGDVSRELLQDIFAPMK